MTPPSLADSCRWLSTGTEFVLARIDVAILSAPSPLPGWRNAHVVAHVARNADALRRLLTWARTGVETPMYASSEERTTEIERDAQRQDDTQRADAHTSADRFASAVDGLEEGAWTAQVRTARGRLIAASEVPWMRVKEVWLHAVDLGAPVDTLPIDLVQALLDDVAAAFDAKPDRPSLRLVAPNGSWQIGDGRSDVSGSPTSLLGWLIGRTAGADLLADEGLPILPSWL